MTIKELIAKLQEFPEETLVRFQADMGHIDTDEPLIELGGGGAEEPTFLFIDIDG
jgi:hypothetical protein